MRPRIICVASLGLALAGYIVITKLLPRNRLVSALLSDSINFRGVLRDQFGEPVASANVSYTVISFFGYRDGKKVATSNERGEFSIRKYSGTYLEMIPAKPGYALRARELSYGTHGRPTPSHPVTIEMWRMKGAEPLVRFEKNVRLVPAQGAKLIDLIGGADDQPSGDLKLVVTRGVAEPEQGVHVSWSYRLEPVDGGILQVDDDMMTATFEAPDEGYVAFFEEDFDHTKTPWYPGVSRSFFLKSRNGSLYAKFGLSVGLTTLPADQVYASFEGLANAHGSRNWEVDPLKVITIKAK